MRRGLTLLLGAILLCASGCSDLEDPGRPAVPAGRIIGRVRLGGLSTDLEVSASRVADGAAAAYTFRSTPDDSGLYFLDVPAGRYVVSLAVGGRAGVIYYVGATPGDGNQPPDTLRVAASAPPVTADFLLGGLTCALTLSPGLNGEQGEILLHRRNASARDDARRGAATILDGRLEVQIPGVLPGEYQVEVVLGRRFYACDCAYDGEHLWLPGTRDRAASPWQRVAADSVLALTCELPITPAHLEGRVGGAWQDMGVGTEPALSIVTTDSVTVMGPRRLLGDGRFALDFEVPGPVKLCVTQSGIEQWIGGQDFAAATVYPLRLGETISGIELAQSGLRLSVQAPEAAAGAALLRFYDPADLRLLASATVDLSTVGDVGVPNLWPGRFLLQVSRGEGLMVDMGLSTGAAWRPQWYDRATTAAGARIVTIAAAGQIVPLDLTLERGGEIGGTIAQAGGTPTYHYVLLTAADDPAAATRVVVWPPHDSFQFRGLPDGDYKVGSCPGGQGWTSPAPPPTGTVWYPNTADWSAATVLAIRDAGTFTGLVIAVP